jgi:hypothetical protein
MPIKPSARLYNCQFCHCQVMICQPCDRGQRYCAGLCRGAARKKSLKRANQKYQHCLKGRFNNAERQRRFRQRKKQACERVTDQASPSMTCHDLLVTELRAVKHRNKLPLIVAQTACHFCGCAAGPFFRTGFLKKRTVYPYVSKIIVNKGEPIHGH